MVAAPEGGHSPLSGVFSAISPVGRWVRVGGHDQLRVGGGAWSAVIKGATPAPPRMVVVPGMDHGARARGARQ